MLSSIEILILAVIQGITEFLPISSVAHLGLIAKYYEFTNEFPHLILFPKSGRALS